MLKLFFHKIELCFNVVPDMHILIFHSSYIKQYIMSCSCPTYKVDISPDDVINLLSEGKRCRPCIGCKQWKNCPQRITTALSCFVFGYLELVYRNSINYIYEYIGDDIQTFLQSPKRIRHVCSIVRDYLLRKMKLTRTEANIAIEMWKSFAFGVENFNSP